MSHTWTSVTAISTLAVIAVVGAFLWKKNKKRHYTKVGHISKLFFFPVKSLKGIEVKEGNCTKLGFEVNGLIDRSFMLINESNVLVSQRQAPTLAFLQPEIINDKLVISGPDHDPLTVDIKKAPHSNDKIIQCQVHSDAVSAVDCGEKAARWFQYYLQMPNIRLVQFFPELPNRKFTKDYQFYIKFRNENPISFQDLAAFHLLSQPSIDDLNKRIEDSSISVRNFRPNILVDGCAPYAEDAWEYMKFDSGAELHQFLPVTRCLLTTVKPDEGILTSKEPLTSLRKYRIPKDPELVKKLGGSLPCLGTACNVLKTGKLKLNDDILATITHPIDMILK